MSTIVHPKKMTTLVYRKRLPLIAVAALPTPQLTRIVPFETDDDLSGLRYLKGDKLVILDAPDAWVDAVRDLVERGTSVWVSGTDAVWRDSGATLLNEDVVHALRYNVGISMCHYEQGRFYAMVRDMLRPSPQCSSDIFFMWLERSLRQDVAPFQTMRRFWSMREQEMDGVLESVDMQVTRDRYSACWLVRPRFMPDTRVGMVFAVVACTFPEFHHRCMALKGHVNESRVSFSVVIHPALKAGDPAVVNWRAQEATRAELELWHQMHDIKPAKDWRAGTFAIPSDHVAWLESLRPSVLRRVWSAIQAL